MNTARRKHTPVAPGIETARPDAEPRTPAVTDHAAPSDVDPPRRTVASHNNISLPRSPLIGRDHELAAVQQLLLQEQVGLLTLTGPGGIGKTRLAMQVASNLLDHFVDGVYFVSLAPISDPALVSAAIAQTLGVQESGSRPIHESLHDYLRDKQLLLVLDNFEQVVTAAPAVGELLSTCARLKVLVTSRATLHLYGEQEFPVPPLALPDPKQLAQTNPTASLAHYAAIDLFCQRALAAKPDFALIPSNAAAVAEICMKLDGLPLAIELAASRIKLFSPSVLLTRLNQRLMLLTGGPQDLPSRQRTLRDTMAWSYDLLRNEEQRLFRHLAVFVGGFTLEAAQTLGAADGALGIDVLDGITSLVDKNLLLPVAEQEGEPRFGMFETIREYGIEQLVASGEVEMIRRRHADFFLALAETTEPDLLGAQRTQAVARLEADLDNLRAAFVWSQRDITDGNLGLQLAGSLAWFAHFNNHATEVRSWLKAALQRDVEPTAARAKALWGAGLMGAIQGDFPMARTELEESVTLWRAIGDQLGLAVALRELGVIAYCQRDFKAAQLYSEESVALCRVVGNQWQLALALDNLAHTIAAQADHTTGRILFAEEIALFQAVNDRWGLATALIGLGWIAGQLGDYATASEHFANALKLRRGEMDKWNITEALYLLGEALQQQGELEQAGNLYREGLRLSCEVGDKGGMALAFYHLGTLAQAYQQPERAARLLVVAATQWSLTGGASYHTLTDPAAQERAIAQVRAGLGAKTFAARWAEGQALTLEQAIEYALATPKAPEGVASASEDNPVVAPTLAYPAGLTTREVEVLRLIVQGLAYPEIADKLVISPRTVNAHVSSIFNKLGVTTRAAATRFAIDHHLG